MQKKRRYRLIKTISSFYDCVYIEATSLESLAFWFAAAFLCITFFFFALSHSEKARFNVF
jgi:hypothetical protein